MLWTWSRRLPACPATWGGLGLQTHNGQRQRHVCRTFPLCMPFVGGPAGCARQPPPREEGLGRLATWLAAACVADSQPILSRRRAASIPVTVRPGPPTFAGGLACWRMADCCIFGASNSRTLLSAEICGNADRLVAEAATPTSLDTIPLRNADGDGDHALACPRTGLLAARAKIVGNAWICLDPRPHHSSQRTGR